MADGQVPDEQRQPGLDAERHPRGLGDERQNPLGAARLPPATTEIAAGAVKHPALAINARGETLAVWTTGTGWAKGGEVAWTMLDASGKPTGERGKAPGVPVWSHAAAYAEPDGGFVIVR